IHKRMTCFALPVGCAGGAASAGCSSQRERRRPRPEAAPAWKIWRRVRMLMIVGSVVEGELARVEQAPQDVFVGGLFGGRDVLLVRQSIERPAAGGLLLR